MRTSHQRGRTAARLLLGSFLATAGLGHLTFVRREFQAQVPDWVPGDKDDIVLMSGVAELALASALVFLPREQRRLGNFSALFFAGVFPGNIAQYTGHRDGLGLDTDTKRLIRLFGQPLLIAWALWSTRTHRR